MMDRRPRRVPVLDRRRLGVLLHLSSLPGDGPHGTLGPDARRFVDVLASAGASVWQVLPLGPPAGGSPYNSLSAHAGDPGFIDLPDLALHGLVDRGAAQAAMIDVSARPALLQSAYSRFVETAGAAWQAQWADFQARHHEWLTDYCIFECVRAEQGGAPWWQWPAALRDRDAQVLARYAQSRACAVAAFAQFIFFQQWQALRDYALSRGVRFFGDMPMFMAEDSADVWAHRELFVLNADGHPEIVAGVPPDYFSAQGQRWGNPHYRWEHMAADGFAWWRKRVMTQRELFDWLRIDHFRGFVAAWAIPAAAQTAASGQWMAVPGDALLAALEDALGDLPLIAEDLGIITDDVLALRDRYDLPGMRVLQFGFDGDPHSPHLPHNYATNSVAYTGTHDNDTTSGWYGALDARARAIVRDYLPDAEADPAWAMLRTVTASVARFAVIPWQDVLGLGSDARMNTPGMSAGNWRFRFRWEDVPDGTLARLAHLAFLYGRARPAG